MNVPAFAASQNGAVSGLVTGALYFFALAITRASECRLRRHDARREGRRCHARSRDRSSSPAPWYKPRRAAAARPRGFLSCRAVDGMVAAQPAAIGVERQLADA